MRNLFSGQMTPLFGFEHLGKSNLRSPGALASPVRPIWGLPCVSSLGPHSHSTWHVTQVLWPHFTEGDLQGVTESYLRTQMSPFPSLGSCICQPTDARGPLAVQALCHQGAGVHPVLGLGLGTRRVRTRSVRLKVFEPWCASLCVSVSLSHTRAHTSHSLVPTFVSSQTSWGRLAASVKTRSEPNMTRDRKEGNSCIRHSFPVSHTSSETFDTIFRRAPGVSIQPVLREEREPVAPSLTSR